MRGAPPFRCSLMPPECPGIRLSFRTVPEDRNDPPARAVVEELDAVDAPREGLGVRGRVQGLVGAEHVDDVAEAVLTASDLALEEAVALEARAGTRAARRRSGVRFAWSCRCSSGVRCNVGRAGK